MAERTHPADHPVLEQLAVLGYRVIPETLGGELYGYRVVRYEGDQHLYQFDYRFREGESPADLLDRILAERAGG